MMGSYKRQLLLSLMILLSAAGWADLKLTNENGGGTGVGPPIILVPGDGGSQIQATINKTKVVHYICDRTSKGYFDLWLNLEELAPLVLDCFVDNMKLIYNTTTRRSQNNEGVTTRVPGWGNTSTVEWLDPSQSNVGHYFSTIVNNAVSWGYTRGKNIRGAPYDFRKAPNEMPEYFVKLKQLIEETYYLYQNQRVILIGHSMGNPFVLYFLNRQTQAWKDKFIGKFISIAAPWGGSMKILMMLASGYNLDHWRILLSPISIRPEQRSMTSTTFLMPSDKFWNSSEVLVQTLSRNYTVNDYQQYFTDIKFPIGWEMYKDTGKLVHDLKAPGVEVHCLVGTKVPTPAGFKYGKGFPDVQPTIEMGDGDGTVNLRSLKGCLRWRKKQKQAVYYQEFADQLHLEILLDPNLVKYIKSVVHPSSSNQQIQNDIKP